MTPLAEKRAHVLARLRAAVPRAGRLAVAFSGGVDSTLLLALACEALGPARVVAVTARSPSLARDELAACASLAARLGVSWLALDTGELERDGYRQNGADRCYHCKTELFERIAADLRGKVALVAYGALADDLGDHRPGMRAAHEHGVLAPLADAGLVKADVRALSRELDLPTWDKPAQPCLASRVPYGEAVDAPKLARIERAEALLRREGVAELRVRHHGPDAAPIARIEVPLDALPRLLDEPTRRRVVDGLRAAGFRYVTLDLEGFRSGRLNEVLAAAAGATDPSARAAGRPLPVLED